MYWYHPHLHMMAEKQMNEGIGGLIIVRDSTENSLPLPRTYGVDDIPIVLTDRKFDASNQIVSSSFGDSMVTNGTLRAQYTMPAQVVRLRILDAATERSYNLGFSDNRNFYVIGTDGGLIDTPVAVNRFLISPGERVEILVNMNGQSGTNFNLMSYNTALSQNIAGGESFPNGPFQNALGHTDFRVLHINVGNATSNAITQIPGTMVNNVYYTAGMAQITRNIAIGDTQIGQGPLFRINNKIFDINVIDYNVPLNNCEIWSLNSTSTFSHPFHIHDVEFYILSINGAAPPAYQAGWKDVILVKAQTIVKFIARFNDYSDSLHPYMFHCHIALHEDEGMMGQFVVGNSPAGIRNVLNNKMKLYPNPGSSKVNFEMADNIQIKEAVVLSANGQAVLIVNPNTDRGVLDVSMLSNGIYFIKMMDSEGNSYLKTYLKE
jgi:blue copper oxidase